jgi:hypothetical protein
MNKAKALVDKLQQKAAIPGNGPNPKPASGTSQKTAEQVQDNLRATGMYSRF